MDLNLATFAPVIRALGVAGLPLLETALTRVVTGYTGPFGLLVEPALNSLWPAINAALGLAPDAPPDQTAAKIMDDPDAARNALANVQEDHSYLLASDKQGLDYDLAAQAQQTALVQAEVANPSMFVAGWRPAAAWVLVAGLANFVAAPWVVWVLAVVGRVVPPPPSDVTVVLSMLGTLLGLGTMRSYDKRVGTAFGGVGSGTTRMPSPPVAAKRGR